jgi:tetratricopeptide (TPR) repeat protein
MAERAQSCGFHVAASFAMRRFQFTVLGLLLWIFCPWQIKAQGPAGSPAAASSPSGAELSRSRQLMQQGKYDEAIAELEHLWSSQPEIRGLAHALGVAYYKKGDYLHASDWLEKSLAQDPGDNEGRQLLGLSYYRSGRARQAIPLLERVQVWYPSANVDASYILGQCYIQTQDYRRARQAFARMFDLPSDSASSYLLTARMLFRREFTPVAVEYAEKAVALDPKLPLAHFLLGEIHLFQSHIPEAISSFEQELSINPGDAATYYKLADAYSRIEQFEPSERLLQRAIWLDPTATGPYVLMGKVLEKKGEPELAAHALERAARMDPNNPMTHHLLGQAYRELGRHNEAEHELKLASELEEKQNAEP